MVSPWIGSYCVTDTAKLERVSKEREPGSRSMLQIEQPYVLASAELETALKERSIVL